MRRRFLTVPIPAAGAGLMLVLTGCGSEDLVAEAEVLEEGVLGAVESDELMGSADSAECPGDLVLEDGASIDCAVIMSDGSEQTATIIATELGDEEYDFQIGFS